ncbi:Ribonuclease P protein component [Gracilariopsis chorda]|uniref:Ribonuclease P protein component n=1 Tax=Gracilariopsis chorda TaxID=448386 RepID=A0A2V3ILM8_9FLOR|nr:Ribonuclease P protein component [Gracilariopsis chorda]|eukprot:PXF42986.1 Ribonuclease P protein component [Gracilariopsis chorda]
MQTFVTPLLSCQRAVSVKCCNNGAPAKARRLSLPTFRERRALQENHIERAGGRASKFVRTETFNLMVWPLTVTKPQDDRFKSAFDQFQRTINKYELLSENDSGINDDAVCSSTTDENLTPESSVQGDKLLAEQQNQESDSQLLSQEVRFDIPSWAYIVRVRASKSVMGKRAVQRNRAKRRIRAAAARLMPDHARRGYEYVFSTHPEALICPFSVILSDVETALRVSSLWQDYMTTEELRREMYSKR